MGSKQANYETYTASFNAIRAANQANRQRRAKKHHPMKGYGPKPSTARGKRRFAVLSPQKQEARKKMWW